MVDAPKYLYIGLKKFNDENVKYNCNIELEKSLKIQGQILENNKKENVKFHYEIKSMIYHNVNSSNIADYESVIKVAAEDKQGIDNDEKSN